ncbi:MAG: polysaccharide deacetylase family protein [Filimonas sp.]|nr:polysaccharide deacetylase family protein [Filimonas sp.]
MRTNLEKRILHGILILSINTLAILTGCSNSPQDAAKGGKGKDSTVTAANDHGPHDKTIATGDSKFAWKPPVYDSTKKYIYLTFDDGPQPPGTHQCFNICKELGIKATFFMVGQHASSPHLQALVDSIREGYPEILLANHSNTHASNHYQYFYQHPQMSHEDFLVAQKKLNVPYKIIRLPGNSAWVREGEVRASKLVKPVCMLLDSSGYNVIGWDVEWNFNHKTATPVQSADAMINMVNVALQRNETHTKNHVVILTHDRMFRHPSDADSLRKFITELKANPNYVFETIDNYPRLKTPSLEAKQ